LWKTQERRNQKKRYSSKLLFLQKRLKKKQKKSSWESRPNHKKPKNMTITTQGVGRMFPGPTLQQTNEKTGRTGKIREKHDQKADKTRTANPPVERVNEGKLGQKKKSLNRKRSGVRGKTHARKPDVGMGQQRGLEKREGVSKKTRTGGRRGFKNQRIKPVPETRRKKKAKLRQNKATAGEEHGGSGGGIGSERRGGGCGRGRVREE